VVNKIIKIIKKTKKYFVHSFFFYFCIKNISISSLSFLHERLKLPSGKVSEASERTKLASNKVSELSERAKLPSSKVSEASERAKLPSSKVSEASERVKSVFLLY
jgi:hypothetical protein